MDVDPVASFQMWAVEFEVGGRTFEVPALPASDWLPILMGGNLTSILDLLDRPEVDEMLFSGEVTGQELETVLTQVVEQVAGRPVYPCLILAYVLRMNWTVLGGDLARRGFRWDQVSLGAAMDAIHATIEAHLKPEFLDKFHQLLDSEPSTPGVGGKTVRPNRAKALADFEDLAGPKPEPVRASAGPSGGGRPRTRRQPRQSPQGGR